MGGQTSSIRFPRWVQTVVIGRRPGWTLVRLGLLIIGAFVIFNFVLTPPVRVTGISMLPTYHTGQINFINRIAYLRHEPRRGDVIGVRFSGESRLLMKRIVALPGETIAFADGFILINGQPLDEPYVKMRSDWNHAPIQLGPNDYYVVGDNRSMAFEDHTQGKVDRRRIVGRILFHGSS